MSKLRSKRTSVGVALGAALACAAACSASGPSTSSRLGGGGSSASGPAGASAGANLTTGATGNILTSSGGASTSPDGGCQHVEVNFVPKIPTIFVLVDRSDSMFQPDNTTKVASWAPLKAGVLDVITQLQSQISFGFGAFTGQAGGKCPIFDPIAPALNNAAAISAVYQPLVQVSGAKGETPVIQVLPLVQDLLAKTGNDGDKYILFVTDGEPDFCDDGDPSCPVDALVGKVQKLSAAGIHTIVFGLKTSLSSISNDTLQAVANAGAGLPVAEPFGTKALMDICYGCSGVAGWKAEWAPGVPDCTPTSTAQTLGTYAPAGGTATVYHPDPADQAALTAQIASVVSGIKSCTFDLGGQISVNLDLLAQASVSLEGQTVPLSKDNGWRMNNSTQLELVGTACTNWRDPKNTHIDFNFPCDIIVVK